MANTLNILERTLAQVGDSTNDVHTLGTANGRLSVYEPLVVRITDHADNDAGEVGADTEKMALFLSRRHGEQFEKQHNVLVRKIHSVGQGASITYTQTAGVIDNVVIADGGSGYSNYGTIVLTPATGTGAVLVAVVTDGVITGVTISNGGTGASDGAITVTNPAPTDVSHLYPDFDYATFE
jgi:hypothetical protein